MPKLLRRNIFGIRNTHVVICFFAYFVLTVFRICNHAQLSSAFIGMNGLLCILPYSDMQLKIFRFTLPDHIYMASYSKAQREEFMQKGIWYRDIWISICCILVCVLPVMVYDIYQANIGQVVFGSLEMGVIFTLVCSGNIIAYFSGRCGDWALILMGLGRFALAVLFDGLTDLDILTREQSLVEMVTDQAGDVILLVILVGIGSWIIILCKKRYLRQVICYMADYEQSREKDKKG